MLTAAVRAFAIAQICHHLLFDHYPTYKHRRAMGHDTPPINSADNSAVHICSKKYFSISDMPVPTSEMNNASAICQDTLNLCACRDLCSYPSVKSQGGRQKPSIRFSISVIRPMVSMSLAFWRPENSLTFLRSHRQSTVGLFHHLVYLFFRYSMALGFEFSPSGSRRRASSLSGSQTPTWTVGAWVSKL